MWVEMDQSKVKAEAEWPLPLTVKVLQNFLGFANFYHRLIRNYSSIVSPITSFLQGNPNQILCNEETTAAFKKLNTCFTMAPILKPNALFIVEVDASSYENGAVLSQCHGEPEKPSAFYSQKWTLAEANYDVVNRELLSITKLWKSGDVGLREVINTRFRL